MFQQPFDDRVQAAGADILSALVNFPRYRGDALDAILGKFELQAFSTHQGAVLFGQRGIRLGENTHELFNTQRLEFHTNGHAALQLGNKVRGFGHMERAGGNKKDVVGFHHAVLGGHRTAFHQRQQIALYPFARDTGAARLIAALGDLVNFIDKDNAVLLYPVQGIEFQLFFVDHFPGFFITQHL